MKNVRRSRFCSTILYTALAVSGFLFCTTLQAQTYIPGKVVRPATNATARGILDPNGDGFVSATTSGYFGQDDVSSSNNEIAYKPIYPFFQEPNSDLRRGPDKRFTDYVPSTIDKASYYMYYTGTNVLFRVRMGSIIPGAKGYSYLIDIDGKFGSTGPLADPNYLPASTGVGGNPGFEIEVDLFSQASQTGIAVYNIDGKDKRNDFLPAVYSVSNWLDYSQVSMAATSDNGDPDYYVDFYLPFSALSGITFAAPTTPTNISTSTNLRIIPTTVMAPLPAVGGPKSDIYGLPDGLFPNPNDEYIAMLGSMPPIKMTDVGSGGSGQSSTACTAPPTLNKISSATASTTASGTWTPGNPAKSASPAYNVTVTLYRSTNGGSSYAVAGSTTFSVSSATNTVSWSITGVTVASGNLYYAEAQAVGESVCYQSNTVTATNCVSAIPAPSFDATCNSDLTINDFSKGFSFTNKPSAYPSSFANISNVTRGTSASQTAGSGVAGSGNITNQNNNALTQLFAETGGTAPNITWTFSNGCSGGAPLSSGSYRIWYTDANGCGSNVVTACVVGNGSDKLAGSGTSLAVPTLTSPANGVITTSTTSITVSATQGSTVTFFLNGVSQGTAVAANGGVTTLAIGTTGTATFTIAAGTLTRNDLIRFISEVNGASVATSYCGRYSNATTVSCVAEAPNFTANSTTGLLQPSSGGFIQGTSNSIGGTVTIYNSSAPGTSLGTATVGSTGLWTSTVTPVSGQSYVATVTALSGCASPYSSALLYNNSTTPSSRCTGAAITSYTTSYLNGTSYTGSGTSVSNGPPTSSSFAMNAFATTVSVSWTTALPGNSLISLYEDGNFVASTRVSSGATTAVFSNGTSTGDNLGFYTGTTGSTSPGNVYFTISDTSTTLQTYLPETQCPNVGVVSCPVSTTTPTLTVANCPTCTATGTSSATVPSGGTVTFKLTNVTPNTIYALRSTSGTSYSNSYTVPSNFSGNTIYLTSFPITGTNGTTVTIEAVATTVIVSNNVTVSCAATSTSATVTLGTATSLGINGTIFDDPYRYNIGGTPVGSVNNALGTPRQLYVYLVNSSNQIVNSATVTTSSTNPGTYSFTGLTSGATYNVILDTAVRANGTTLTAASVPYGWSYKAEGSTGGAGDGTANGLVTLSNLTATQVIDFGINGIPLATTATASAQVNPGGTTSVTVPATTFGGSDPYDVNNTGIVEYIRITSFPSNATSITITGAQKYTDAATTITYYANSGALPAGCSSCAVFPASGVYVATSSGGVPTNSNAVQVDPVNGSVTVGISYVTVDNGGKESATATASQPFTDLTVSGTVYHDGNALTDATINGTGIGQITNGAANVPLYVNLVDAVTGNVVATTAVNTGTGAYSFGTADGITKSGSYNVLLSTTQGTIGQTAPVATLASTTPGWVFTGEGATAGGDGSVNGSYATGVVTTATTVNFGVNARPTAGSNTISGGSNPGGTNNFTIPNGSFNPTDVSPGSIASITITSFPTNTTSFAVGTTTYYPNGTTLPGVCPTTTCANFPASGGITVNFSGGNPASTITVDPTSGAVSPVFSYTTTDNGGAVSNNTGSLTINFNTVSISGNVYHDANALTDNLVNGTGTDAGGSLYVNIVSNGSVIGTAAVAANGTYTVSGLDAGTYTAVLTTTNSATTAALPTGWVNTGEGLGSASDGSVGGTTTISVSSNTVNVNFGINAKPTAGTNTITGGANPGGTTNYTIPNGSFNPTDVNPGSVASITITSFPTNTTSFAVGTTTYYPNGTTLPGTCPTASCANFPASGGLNIPFSGGNPTSAVTVDPINGAVSPQFSYTTTDNGGAVSSNTGTLTVNFSTLSIAGTVYNDFDGLTDSQIDGIGSNAGGRLYVNAVSNGIVVGTAAVTSNGTYTISGLDAGSYSLVLTTGSTSATAALPSGFVNTGEGVGAVSDGTVNGLQSVTLTTTSLTARNFGFDQLAVADAKSYVFNPNSASVSSYVNTVNVASTANAGNTYAARIDLSGYASSGAVPGALTGTDVDGNESASLNLKDAVANNSVVIDPATYSGTRHGNTYSNAVMIEYAGIQLQPGGCQGSDIGNSACVLYNNTTSKWEIPAYDLSQLKVLVRDGAGSLAFQYAWKDAAGFTGAAQTYAMNFSSPLPVHLVHFSGEKRQTNAHLTWSVTDEISFLGYGVERSLDGRNFEEVGMVVARGAGSVTSNYQYDDNLAGLSGNYVYYRLKLKDLDGRFTYSSTVRMALDGALTQAVRILGNPVSGPAVRVEVTSALAGKTRMMLADASGRIIWTQEISVVAGVSTFRLDLPAFVTQGSYTLRTVVAGEQFANKILVSR